MLLPHIVHTRQSMQATLCMIAHIVQVLWHPFSTLHVCHDYIPAFAAIVLHLCAMMVSTRYVPCRYGGDVVAPHPDPANNAPHDGQVRSVARLTALESALKANCSEMCLKRQQRDLGARTA